MYIKVPVEMAEFALKELKYRQCATYLAAQFLYSGNAHRDDKPVQEIANATGIPESTTYRYFKWLCDRNWFGKNNYGRYYFQGINRVHSLEGWHFARAAIMLEEDLKTIKGFMAGVACASLAQTREGQRREHTTPRSNHRSKNTAAPISLSVLAGALQVSKKTAYRLRKSADELGYIENRPNLTEVINWTPNDLVELKKQDLRKIPLVLKRNSGEKVESTKSIDKIRYKHGKLFLQEPNIVECLIQLKSRRGLSKYQPPIRV